MINAGLGAAASVAGGGSPNLGGLLSPLQGMISTFGRTAVSDLMPKQLSGFAPSSAMYTIGEAGVYLIKYAPNRDEFNKIDDFFTAYGYAVNRIATPEYHNRANHNYLKTNNVLVIATGGIPQEDYKRICQIFDEGVTFWHNPGTYGNYNVNNDPI